MGCCPLFTRCFKTDRFSSCGSVGISFPLQHRFTQQMLSESGSPSPTVLLFFNLIIPLFCKNDGTLCRGPRRDAAFTKGIWLLLSSHRISCYTANRIPVVRWRRSEERPHGHAWVGLRRADMQVVVYNCAQYDCMLRSAFCIFLLLPAKALHPVVWCSGR